MEARVAAAIMMVAMSVVSYSQKKIGDFIESKSYNDELRGTQRTVQYRVEGDKFVSENGRNRYTRALYGGVTDFRVETSDRPVFATFRRGEYHNIAFRVVRADGVVVPMDEIETCRAEYDCGRREYTLKDRRLGGVEIHIEVLASTDIESAMWKMAVRDAKEELTIEAILSYTKVKKMNRSGDIGVDPKDGFEADGKQASSYFRLKEGRELYLVFATGMKAVEEMNNTEAWERAEAEREKMARHIEFRTPDEWLNALDGAIVAAAEGIWDGETWLHGAIGWRMQLAGWRAGYTGDYLGWQDRQQRHLDAYAASQVRNVEPIYPHPTQDQELNIARAEKKWGTQMYSNGYLCRYPNKSDVMHHYDMNLNFVDELLEHIDYDARKETLRRYWELLKLHLEWEKRNYDPDDDGLYDAYCCIWASDALYYSGGGVTHSTAYNLRANKYATKIAEILGEDGTRYKEEYEKIAKAIDSRLWIESEGHWAEYEDYDRLNLHGDAGLWTTYTAIDCEVGTEEQRHRAAMWAERHQPRIKVDEDNYTISTTDWMPYSWSINNVAPAENYNMALAFFEAGMPDAGYRMLRANVVDNMILGISPGNFGQLSFCDAARGECYRDFGDVVGTAARCLIKGLWGIRPHALEGRCVVEPGFPAEWDSATVRTPYMTYTFRREGDECRLRASQQFAEPLKIEFRMRADEGVVSKVGTAEREQEIVLRCPRRKTVEAQRMVKSVAPEKCYQAWRGEKVGKKQKIVDISGSCNDTVANIFKHEYLTPRPNVTTLQIPKQGIGEWCHPQLVADVSDSAMRALPEGVLTLPGGLKFRLAQSGNNVVFVSIWDNFPTSVEIPVGMKGRKAYLLVAGSTNHMQTRIENARVLAEYTDGTSDTLKVVPPYNYVPIEQEYFEDGKAFDSGSPRPLMVSLGTGKVGFTLTSNPKSVYGPYVDGGVATVLQMPLDRKKTVRSIRVSAEAHDIVFGVMGITIEQ
ncbi:MAG: DUF4450 domain-containing protein [Bacteroidales bacterium]|nr:DUF4450 domain-containing protein [Bacteroidales bacterium]